MEKKIQETLERVCQLLGNVTPEQIRSRERTYRVATARQLVMWHLVKNCGFGYNEIGKAMGKSHATVIYSEKQIDNIIELGRAYDKRICEAALLLKKEADELRQDD